VPYLDYIAPALLRNAGDMAAAFESAWADHGQDRVGQDIPGLLNTPLGATDLLAGDLMWIAFRATLLSLLFVAVIILLSAAPLLS